MKKFASLILILALAFAVNAQNRNRTAAFNYLRYGKLEKAKEAIDKATVHNKTKDEAKTWFYRGNVYLALQLTEEEEYQGLAEDPLSEAYEAYQKALKLDEKNEFTEDIMDRVQVCAEQYYNSGVAAYNNQNYDKALKAFKMSANINRELGRTDTMAFFYAGQSAYFSDEYDDAVAMFDSLMKHGFQDISMYRVLADIQKKQGDTAQAVATIQKGREAFPEDYNLIIDEVNIYIATDEKEKAADLLELAMSKDSKDPLVFFNAGVIFSDLGKLDKAIKAYDKAIELKPDYFDPYYNMGALYVNQASEILLSADTLNPMDKKEAAMYDELKAEADSILKVSLPYIEKADELHPEDDPATLKTLRDIYVRLKMNDKVKAVNERLKNINQ